MAEVPSESSTLRFDRGSTTVAGLPSEDIVVLASGTLWQVPWELMMLGPFASCGLLDGTLIRHVTVPAMVASAVRQGSAPDTVLLACDYTPMPVFDAEMPLLDAAVLVAEAGWELAVVMADEPRVITARSVYRALVGSRAGDGVTHAIRSTGLTDLPAAASPTWLPRPAEAEHIPQTRRWSTPCQ